MTSNFAASGMLRLFAAKPLFLCLLLFASAVASAAPAEFWIVQSSGASRWSAETGVLSSVSVADKVSLASVDASTGSIWLVAGDRLLGFDRQGQAISSGTLAIPGKSSILEMQVDQQQGIAWLFDQNTVWLTNLSGTLLHSLDQKGSFSALAYDADSRRIHVVKKRSLVTLRHEAKQVQVLQEIELPPNLEADAIALSEDGQLLYLAGQRALWTVDLATGRLNELAHHGISGLKTGLEISDDGRWVVGLHEIASFDETGSFSSTLRVFPAIDDVPGGSGHVYGAAANRGVLAVISRRALAVQVNSMAVSPLESVTGSSDDGVEVLALHEVDSEPPEVEILSPIEGEVARSFDIIRVRAIDRLSDPDFKNGIVNNSAGCDFYYSEALSSSADSATYVCDESAPDGALTIEVSIPDTVGNYSETKSVQVSVDTKPPYFDASAVQLVTNGDGTVTVSAPSGSVEPGAELVVSVFGDEGEIRHELTVDASGGFTLQVDAEPGDRIEIVASDIAGNSTETREFEVKPPNTYVQIHSPMDGDSFRSGESNVVGSYRGPANAGIVVNGVIADIGPDGNFFARNVQLPDDGSNRIAARLNSVEGTVATDTVDVVIGSGGQKTIELLPEFDSGLAPIEVGYSVAIGSESIVTISIDFEGDGVFDQDFPSDKTVFHQFETPGLYYVTARASVGGVQVQDIAPIFISARNPARLAMEATWQGLTDSLLSGDVNTALHYMTSESRSKYTRVFESIVPEFPDILDSFIEIDVHSSSLAGGSYAVTRKVGGVDKVFLVEFVRGKDGVWRISSM